MNDVTLVQMLQAEADVPRHVRDLGLGETLGEKKRQWFIGLMPFINSPSNASNRCHYLGEVDHDGIQSSAVAEFEEHLEEEKTFSFK